MIFILAFSVFALTFYVYLIRSFTFWSRRGIHQSSVFSIWKHNIKLILGLQAKGEIFQSSYNEFADKRYFGMYKYMTPVLCITDIDLIKQIGIRAFDHFSDRHPSVTEDLEPLWAKNIVFLRGRKWQEMRTTLSPSFTSSKMRDMFDFISNYSKEFVEHFKTGSKLQVIEAKDTASRFANDVNAFVAFGIKCNSLEERNNELYVMGKRATNFSDISIRLKYFLMQVAPKLATLLGIKLFSATDRKFLDGLVKTNVELRETTGTLRQDFLQLLIQARNEYLKKHEVDTANLHFTNSDFVAQTLIFLIGGFESVASTLSFLFYEIAANADVQENLRNEVLNTLESNKVLTYECASKLKYMDMVIKEVLRKWPTTIFLDRECVKPYTIEPMEKGEKPLYLNPGDLVWLPVYPMHKDPKFFLNPEKFDPERFSSSSNVNNALHLAFGIGPRNCLGKRFAILETKTLLFYILSNFELTLTPNTDAPEVAATEEFPFFPKNKILLGLKKLN